jgi:6-phosphogluconolactonase
VVSAFAIDHATGKLTLLNQQPSGGRGACHVIVDRTGRCLLVANYGSGSAASIPIGDDGRLGEPGTVVQHEGKGLNEKRQEGPHAHSAAIDPRNRFAYVADLGIDRLMIYRLDAQKGTMTPNDPPYAAVAPGAGPRHFTFHVNGKHAYVINELANTITAFEYDPATGKLTGIQTVNTLPDDFAGANTTAEVVVHPSGRFVYGSNRGHDSIAIFACDPQTGRLTVVGHESTRGKTPRNFNIDPTGQYLIAANQGSDTIIVFRIDQASGRLKAVGDPVAAPTPVCIKFLPVR